MQGKMPLSWSLPVEQFFTLRQVAFARLYFPLIKQCGDLTEQGESYVWIVSKLAVVLPVFLELCQTCLNHLLIVLLHAPVHVGSSQPVRPCRFQRDDQLVAFVGKDGAVCGETQRF